MTVSRSLLIGLIVSATVNVFLVGGVAGVVLARRTAPTPLTTAQVQTERPARPPLWAAGQALSPESRRGLRLALRDANQKSKATIAEARQERGAALEALRTQPYDPAAVARHLAAARTRDSAARSNIEAALVTFADTLSPRERATLADGLTRVYAPRPRPGSDH
ncbi:MAG: periplasmic heavy metal sensor [Alphaproteobacteria bacterium]|nr:periplasmic heavy metal sensor [Alphaproteobacteria bacterium]